MYKSKVLQLMDELLFSVQGVTKHKLTQIREELLRQELCSPNCFYKTHCEKLREQVVFHRQLGIEADNDVLALEKVCRKAIAIGESWGRSETEGTVDFKENMSEFSSIRKVLVEICGE